MLKFALLALFLVGVASSERESFPWENLTWSFEIDQPHIVDGDTIRTYYGSIHVFVQSSAENGFISRSIGNVESLSGRFYLEKYPCNEYWATCEKTYANEWIAGGECLPGFSSDMNLTDFIDFLRSVKIEPITP